AGMNFPTNKTIVFWWRHDQPKQLQTTLNKGYATVICPRLPLYFDFVQDSAHSPGRKWGRFYNPLEAVYNFNVDSLPGVTSKNKEQVLGIQANLWTETISDNYRLDYMLYPRMAALAEAAWTPAEKKSYPDFAHTLKKHFALYSTERINFYNPFRK